MNDYTPEQIEGQGYKNTTQDIIDLLKSSVDLQTATMLGYEEAETLVAALEAAEKELKEYENLIALQHTRTIKADKLWRHAHPEQQHKSPDLGTLVDWLLFRAKRAEAYAAKLEKAGDALYGCSAVDFDKACVAWEVARKEKP